MNHLLLGSRLGLVESSWSRLSETTFLRLVLKLKRGCWTAFLLVVEITIDPMCRSADERWYRWWRSKSVEVFWEAAIGDWRQFFWGLLRPTGEPDMCHGQKDCKEKTWKNNIFGDGHECSFIGISWHGNIIIFQDEAQRIEDAGGQARGVERIMIIYYVTIWRERNQPTVWNSPRYMWGIPRWKSLGYQPLSCYRMHIQV